MLSESPFNPTLTKAVGLAIATVMALTGCTTGSASAGKNAAESATDSAVEQGVVIRVIDGDTFEAAVDGGEKTIRLLNVDTPETKDPKSPVECMGPEATEALEGLLPVGSKVRLELDKEPLDKYGRTLAGVFDSTGKLVNAEIARLGLGVPVLFEPNRKFHPPVVAAFEDAQARGVGLNSADIPCLPAKQIDTATEAVEAIVAAPLADAVADLDKSHAGLVVALATIAALKAAANAKNHVHWAAYKPAQFTAMVNRLDSAAKNGTARQTAIEEKKKVLADAAAAESARQAAEASAAAAAAAEAERLRNLPPAPAPYVPPAYVPPAYVPPAYVPPAAPAPNPYPGYNGPRCYAPGGKSWTPCSKK